jgi:hypothetical protein
MSDKPQLTAAERDVETALRSLRPTPAQIDPLAATIAARRHNARKRLRLWQVAAAAAAIVIGAGTWLAVKPSRDIGDTARRQVDANDRHDAIGIDLPVEPPTLLVYRRAMAGPPEELETLLDRQARSGSAPDNEIMRVSMLTLWNSDLHSSTGEM